MSKIPNIAAALPAASSFRARLVADLRGPLFAMAALAAAMSIAFPLCRLAASREGYVLHLSDDSFYYFSVAPNIAAGRGPTADNITRTTGWHPLYGFILAGLYHITSPSLDGFPKQAIALNAVLYLLSAYVLYLAAKRWWGRGAGLAAGLLWLTNAHGVYIAAAGLETSVYALCLALVLWRLAGLITRPQTAGTYLREYAILGLCCGLTVLSRTDSILLMPIIAFILLAAPLVIPDYSTNGRIVPRLLGLAIFSLFVVAAYAAWIGYVWHYTHELNQGSAAVKMEWRKFLMRDKPPWAVLGFTLGMWGEFLSRAFLGASAFKWLLTGIPPLLRAAGNRAERGLVHFLWLAPVVLGLAYGLLLDWARAWYCVPAIMTLTLLAVGAGAALLRTPATSLHPLQRLAKNLLGLIAWAVVIESALVFGIRVYGELADHDSEKTIALRAADWLEKNAPPQTRVGCWHSGIIGYYTPNLSVINLDGLNNNDILPILRGDRLLNPYWDKIKLDAVIPPQDVDKATGEVGKKMGRFQWQWGRKKLVKWRDAPGAGPPLNPLDVYEQAFRQKIYRIVETQ